jgi:hypothetical protein
MLNIRHALIIQVVDDGGQLHAKEIGNRARKYIADVGLGSIRRCCDLNYIQWKPGGYYVTEDGALALLNFERTVKRFLDEGTNNA